MPTDSLTTTCEFRFGGDGEISALDIGLLFSLFNELYVRLERSEIRFNEEFQAEDITEEFKATVLSRINRRAFERTDGRLFEWENATKEELNAIRQNQTLFISSLSMNSPMDAWFKGHFKYLVFVALLGGATIHYPNGEPLITFPNPGATIQALEDAAAHGLEDYRKEFPPQPPPQSFDLDR